MYINVCNVARWPRLGSWGNKSLNGFEWDGILHPLHIPMSRCALIRIKLCMSSYYAVAGKVFRKQKGIPVWACSIIWTGLVWGTKQKKFGLVKSFVVTNRRIFIFLQKKSKKPVFMRSSKSFLAPESKASKPCNHKIKKSKIKKKPEIPTIF